MAALIDIEGISFAFHDPQGKSYPVLQDISLKIDEGELVAIVGANGSGKTTLIRHMNGLLLPDSGRVQVAGHDTRSPAGRRAIHRLVGMVFQHPEDQVIASTLEDEVAFGPENLGMPSAEIESRVQETLQAVGLWDERIRPPHLLSAGQIQRLALAGILVLRPRCIIFDEATTMLDPEGRRMTLDWMLRLNSQGITIIYVTHHMEEAAEARRVIALHAGRVALDGTPQQVFGDPAALPALGLELPPAAALAERLRPYLPTLPPSILTGEVLRSALANGNAAPAETLAPAVPVAPAAPLIEVSHLSHTYLSGTPLEHLALTDVSLSVVTGEAHGLLGRTGSGKSTLLQHLNGLLRPQSGQVRVGELNLGDPAVLTRTVIRQVGLVFQNPEMQFFEQYVGDEIAYGPRQLPTDEPLAQRVRRAMELVGLDFDAFKDRLLHTLSGGERRKVALASVLALRPSILLLDEPTAGLDPHAHAEILQRLQELQSGGMTLVLSSHRMEDLAELAQSLSLFDDGRLLLDGLTSRVFAEKSKLESAGLEQPLAVQAAGSLRARGWRLPLNVVTPDQLSAALASTPRPVDVSTGGGAGS